MKRIISTVALSTLLSVSTVYAGGKIADPAVAPIAAIAETDTDPFYVGIGVIWADVSRDCVTPYCPVVRLEDQTWGGIIRAGYDFNENVGIEVRALKTWLDKDWAETTHYGIFLKPFMPIGEDMNVYGLLGYGYTKIVTDCPQLHEEFTHKGFSYGIGLEYDLSDKEDDYESYKENESHVPQFDRPFDGQGDQEVGWGLWIDWQNLLHNAGPNRYRANIVSFGVTYDF